MSSLLCSKNAVLHAQSQMCQETECKDNRFIQSMGFKKWNKTSER